MRDREEGRRKEGGRGAKVARQREGDTKEDTRREMRREYVNKI